LAKALLHLGQGHVWGLVDQAQQKLAMRVELRALRLALPPGRPFARLPRPAHPNDRRRHPDAEPRRRLPRRRP